MDFLCFVSLETLRIHCYLQYILKVRMLTVAYVGMKKTTNKWSKMMSEFMKNVVKSEVEMCMLFWVRFWWFFVDFGGRFGVKMESKIASKFTSKNGGWNLDKEAAAEQLWGGGVPEIPDPQLWLSLVIINPRYWLVKGYWIKLNSTSRCHYFHRNARQWSKISQDELKISEINRE